MEPQKFKPGDRVRVIKYGHPHWIGKDGWSAWGKFDPEMQLMVDQFWFPDATIRLPKDKPDNIISEDKTTWLVDMSPKLVGQVGTIEGSYADLSEKKGWGTPRSERTQKEYSISGISVKTAWYDGAQLELVEDGGV